MSVAKHPCAGHHAPVGRGDEDQPNGGEHPRRAAAKEDVVELWRRTVEVEAVGERLDAYLCTLGKVAVVVVGESFDQVALREPGKGYRRERAGQHRHESGCPRGHDEDDHEGQQREDRDVELALDDAPHGVPVKGAAPVADPKDHHQGECRQPTGGDEAEHQRGLTRRRHAARHRSRADDHHQRARRAVLDVAGAWSVQG